MRILWQRSDPGADKFDIKEEQGMILFSGRANPSLAGAIASELNIQLGSRRISDFPDGEIQVSIEKDLQGKDVYLVQSLQAPVAAHLMEVVLLADACRRRGASRLTAVIPYFGYARQDRRVEAGEPIGARVLADILRTRFDRLVTVDLHNPAIEGFFEMPVEHVSAIPLLAAAAGQSLSGDSVLVAPDLGAVKLAQRYADLLRLPVAYTHKVRLSGEEVTVRNIAGEVADRYPIVVYDMISTGGTMVSAIEELLERGCKKELIVAATHGLFVGQAAEKLGRLPLKKLFVTDSVQGDVDASLPLVRVGLSKVLAEAIERMRA